MCLSVFSFSFLLPMMEFGALSLLMNTLWLVVDVAVAGAREMRALPQWWHVLYPCWLHLWTCLHSLHTSSLTCTIGIKSLPSKFMQGSLVGVGIQNGVFLVPSPSLMVRELRKAWGTKTMCPVLSWRRSLSWYPSFKACHILTSLNMQTTWQSLY